MKHRQILGDNKNREKNSQRVTAETYGSCIRTVHFLAMIFVSERNHKF